LDVEEIRFNGVVGSAFEARTGAMLPGGQEAAPWLADIRSRYIAAGSPKAVRAWVKALIEDEVLTVGLMPEWIQPTKMCWPFHDGKPMVFLGHVDVPDTAAARTHASPSVRLTLFGRRYPVQTGWSMHYVVLDQHPDF
jgi:hypothetical protein